MTAQPLFYEPSVQFEKVAAEVLLPEDPNEWPNELMQELFKQVAYISDFEPHVTMDRVDAERGFGFGHVEVQNKTEVQHGTDPAASAAAGVKSARIPVIIKDRKLQPLDLLITADSKVLPLSENRLRSVIFRPSAFDITGRGPGDMSMIGQLYPPYRQNYGFGGGGATMNVGMGKEGGVPYVPPTARTAEDVRLAGEDYWANQDARRMMRKGAAALLTAIMPTVNESDYNAFFQKVADDRGLQAALAANASAVDALKALASYEPVSARKLAMAAMDHLKPTVAQLRKEPEGYSLKTASHACWLPQVRTMDRGEAVKMFGPKVVLAADQDGAVTMMTQEGVSEAQKPEVDKPELISQFGIYKVQDDSGKEIIGYVFPNLIDIDGTALPIALFTNGSVKAVQADIVGVNVGGGASIPEGPPGGSGCFIQLLSNGRAQATVPMTIQGSMDAPGQGATVLHGQTYDGTPVQVSVQPNIQDVQCVDGRLIIPESFSWMPLDKAEDTHLVETPDGWGAEANAKTAMATVRMRFAGDSFSLEGLPLDKLASEQRSFLSLDDTLFLLAGLGVDLEYAQTKLGEAAAWSAPVEVRVGHYVKTAADVADETRVKAAAVAERMEVVKGFLRKDLLKEAAVIPDPTAVDTVLSLGFLNPENLGTFIAYLPAIDEAQSKMCELLLAARLGLKEVPVGALEKAVKSTEEALEGLKVLAFQKQ